jgi:hypothetical protein
MNSRFFISEAQHLLIEINDLQVKSIVASDAEIAADTDALQKRATQLLQSMVNPTLPSAFKLVDKMLELDWPVDQKVLQKLGAGERMYQG